MDPAKIMRKHVKLMEADYVGPKHDDPNITYTTTANKSSKEAGAISKVTATLRSYASGKYTRLAQNIQRMQIIAQETLELEKQIKEEGRQAIADLFHAEDAAYTRVVETVSFTLELTKDPKPATTVRYKEVLDELQDHLTPELLQVLESIKAKFSTIQAPKPASLKYSAKDGSRDNAGNEELNISNSALSEAPMTKQITAFFSKYLSKILSWGDAYDAKLDRLRDLVHADIYDENAVYESNERDVRKYNPNLIAGFVWNALIDALEHGDSDVAPLGHGAKGGSVSVKAPDNSIFEIIVKQVN